MGWLVAALSGMREEQLVQSHRRERVDQQDHGFVFAFLHSNSLPCFCHWDCASGQLPLWPEQTALAPMPELWGSSNSALYDPMLPRNPVQPALTAHSPSTGFLYQTWATCAIHSPWHLSHCQSRWQFFPLLWATVLHHSPPVVDPSRNVWKCISLSWMPYLKSKGTWQPQNVPPVTEAVSMLPNYFSSVVEGRVVLVL